MTKTFQPEEINFSLENYHGNYLFAQYLNLLVDADNTITLSCNPRCKTGEKPSMKTMNIYKNKICFPYKLV
jgi:hypothetical protein